MVSRPTVAAVATLEPLTAANPAQVAMVATPMPPGSPRKARFTSRNRSSAMLPCMASRPMNTNMGTTDIVYEAMDW